MLKYLLIYFCFLLVGCATDPFDDPPINTTIVNNFAVIEWVRFSNPVLLEEKCIDVGVVVPKGYTIKACATFNLKIKTCTIYSLNPLSLNGEEMTALGHEAKHCFDGEFHD